MGVANKWREREKAKGEGSKGRRDGREWGDITAPHTLAPLQATP